MNATLDPALEASLLDNVADDGEFARVRDVLGASLAALSDFSLLDESLFERLAGGGGRLLDDSNPAPELLRLQSLTLGGLSRLLSLLEAHGFLGGLDAPENGDASAEMEFDLGGPLQPDPLGLDEGDIDGALSLLAPGPDSSVVARTKFAGSVATIAYGLKSQLHAFRARFLVAVNGGHFPPAMEDLDDTRNATGDGVFALLSAVCEAFLPGVKPESLVQNHKSELQRALLVRRGLADFSRSVDRDNWFVQDPSLPAPEQARALQRLGQTLAAFMRSDVFGAMRPGDRFEILKVHRALEGQPLTPSVRNACEGLSKYLESLSSINQRESLRRHDAEALKELQGSLEAARPLMGISHHAASSQVQQALQHAGRLYGRSRDLDALLVTWRLTPPDLNTQGDLEEVIGGLTKVMDLHSGEM